MASRLIKLEDGTLIEVEVGSSDVRDISGNAAQKVKATFDSIKPTLIGACRPVIETWQELNKDVEIDQTEVEIGLSFSIEGNVYLAKSKADANLKIKLILRPKSVTNEILIPQA
ncbi:hypothetical protein H6F86_00260 [Phormidium sp. FACHB-592]|uniref:Trypsin-co-occurring domain-containing protein n=1 Tax=Stenomitos frigidus AS-A4 TaxID=2933935 RepID=A0ABV0KTC6_9CYAN|nr:CU044_2847 family protein [Phormidium sp. FACHB-592]MBD2072366.1 hypothetical protein [Phormidium sp. FACHB-592]